MKGVIVVGGEDRLELLSAMTQARRRLDNVARELAKVIEGVPMWLYAEKGISGILIEHSQDSLHQLTVDYLGQVYRLAFDIRRDMVRSQHSSEQYEYYLELSTWKRTIRRIEASTDILATTESLMWRPLPMKLYIDGDGEVYEDLNGEPPREQKSELVRELLVKMLIVEDTSLE